MALRQDDIDSIADAALAAFNALDGRMRAESSIEIAKLDRADRARLRKRLAKVSNASRAEIERVITDTLAGAAARSTAADEPAYAAARTAGLIAPYAALAESVAMQRLLEDGVLTATSLANIARTGAGQAVYAEFTAALDSAVIGVASGQVSSDAAIRAAIKRVATFTPHVTYLQDDGTVITQSLYAAIRRSVLTATNQMTGRMTDERARELGATHFEVSAHLGARPEHALWQGKVYTQMELVTVCGYGTVEGLHGANCRHQHWPYFPGIMEPTDWSWAQDPGGEQYALSQRQRESERNIREYKARIAGYNGVLKELGAGDRELRAWARAEHDRALALKRKWQAEADRVVALRNGRRRLNREVGR
jgi:hypothetical protein